jgi:4-alpha-glucanotransferase
MNHRRSGLLIPLFSCRTSASWGVGDIGDLAATATWLSDAGQRILQLLPLNEMAPDQQSPYSAISAMAIDPIYIAVPAVHEFQALGGEDGLQPADRSRLDRACVADRVDYKTVRSLKALALRASFDRFESHEWRRDTTRALAFRGFVDAQQWWLDDYALFRALHAAHGEEPWTGWPFPLQERNPEALAKARQDYEREVRFYQFLQWLAGAQWQEARTAARARGVALFGDLPFMVDGDSADVWARQHQFRMDVSIGVPPDAFSATGQDWGMPLYDWPAIEADGYGWLRDRARRSASLYDGYRIDHLVGFYRTYGRPRSGGDPSFTPAEEPAQRSLGERVLAIFREPGSEIIAEDLGIVPDFVRASLDRQGIPGFRVFRWERRWREDGHPFRDPATYPEASVATSGTHDTEPMAVWWRDAPAKERHLVSRLPSVERLRGTIDLMNGSYRQVRDVLLEVLFASASDILIVPIQDVFGWPDRINEPATVTGENWTFRLPWPVDRLHDVPEARERQATLRRWAEQYGRLSEL